MNLSFILDIFKTFTKEFLGQMEIFWPKILAAIIIIILGIIISYGIYKLIMYVFWKFGIVDLIDRLWTGFEEQTTHIVDKTPNNPPKEKKEDNKKTEIPKKVSYDRITAKATSYYVFLLFFRWAVVVVWITEIEQFMQDIIEYLPSLFVGIMIGFFGVRFANSVHDIIYQALELSRDKTSKIIAMGAKIIIMFFTLMIMLNYIKIVDQFIINALFLAFMTTLTISFWLAFGIGGKDIAREILESFRK